MPIVLLGNIPKLLDSLRQHNHHLTVFDIFYNNLRYVVIFEDMKNLPHPDHYFSAKITFIKMDDTNEELVVYANALKIDKSLHELARYFNVTGDGSYVDWIKDFYRFLNGHIPEQYEPFDRQYNNYAVNILNNYEPTNGNCCYDARRNHMPNSSTEYKYRTIFNTEKTKILRPTLFDKLGGDPHISFYFRETNELDDHEILEKFKNQEPNDFN